MSRSRRRSFLQALIVLLILLFWGKALADNWQAFTTFPWRFAWPAMLLALLIRFVQMFLNATIWWRALALSDAPISYRLGLSLFLKTQIARYLPGGVWDVVGRFALGREAGVSKRSMAASIGLEMGLQILSGSLFLLLALTLRQDLDAQRYLWLGAAVALGAVIALSPPVFTFLVNQGLRLLRKPRLAMRLTYGDMLILFLARLASHAMVGLGFYLFTLGLTPIPWSDAPLLLSSYVGSWLIGYLAMLAPMGIGVREGALVLLLGERFPFAVITASAVGYRALIALRDLLAAALGAWLTPKA